MAASSESQRLQSLARFGLTLVALALMFTVLGAWYATSRPVAVIGTDTLKHYQESLQSYTAESYFLADQYRHGRALANYTAVSTDKLHQAVSDLADSLETQQSEPSIESKVADTADQANKLAEVLGDFTKAADSGQHADFTGKLKHIQDEVSGS
jgi:hypothetical protein